MSDRPLELGAVYQPDWDDRPIRVIAFNSAVVMYDCWWSHSGTWGFAKLSGTVSYYRLAAQFLLARASYVRTEPLSDDELGVHRPDLPLAFGQCEGIHWSDKAPESPAQLSEMLTRVQRVKGAANASQLLAAPEVYLSPFGPKGSAKPATLVKARNGQAFTASELLWHAWQLQVPHVREARVTDGVGLYRLGFQKRTPSYYVWGAKSKLEEASGNAA